MRTVDLRGKVGKSPLGDLGVQRPAFDSSSLEETTTNILSQVKTTGDEAVRKFTVQFDKADIKDLRLSDREIDEAENLLEDDLKQAIATAKNNIEKFHADQIKGDEFVETMPGVQCWRKTVAITKIFRVGGVQAIAAMAYGTETIPKVFKIYGPGNQYVMCAKQLVQKEGVAIDLPAGPSEVAIYADETARPAFIAADLLSQAEHGIDSQVLLVTYHQLLIDEVIKELDKQIIKLPRKDIVIKALENSKIILVKNETEAIDLLNEYAPEH